MEQWQRCSGDQKVSAIHDGVLSIGITWPEIEIKSGGGVSFRMRFLETLQHQPPESRNYLRVGLSDIMKLRRIGLEVEELFVWPRRRLGGLVPVAALPASCAIDVFVGRCADVGFFVLEVFGEDVVANPLRPPACQVRSQGFTVPDRKFR